MPEPRAAFEGVDPRLWPSISAAMPAPKPPKARGRVWAYIMGWISPQWPKADPRVCHALEAELGLEHQPEFMPPPEPTLIIVERKRIPVRGYKNKCLDCGAQWESTEADYLCASCHDKEVAELGEPPEPVYQTIRA